MKTDPALSSTKDRDLVHKRRSQMIQGALMLFKEKGFHRTTTREIAKASGFSIGTLYEYIRTKEDVLYFVCESIYEQVQARLETAVNLKHSSVEHLASVIRSYFQMIDQMQEEILILYQEAKSLTPETKSYVLKKEKEMVAMLERVIMNCLSGDQSERDVSLIANNIFIQGQMWAFRRWMLQKVFTLNEYIDRQMHYLFTSLELDTSRIHTDEEDA